LNGSDERAGELVDEKSLPVKASLTITNLSFAYPEQPNEHVISKLNLTVDSGQKIGVVGHSGAGKSTLIGLLLGFYDPMSGDIAVNDINISTKDPSFIRSVSSLVPQDTNLFNRTIRENIG
jgi:ABC-type multidrug transport system fused ATPase/permease subunit